MGTDGPWEIDMRHVSNAVAARVMAQFQRQFLVDQGELEVIPVVPLEEYVPIRLNPALHFARQWIVHPVKRALGIGGPAVSGPVPARRPLALMQVGLHGRR